MINFVENFNSDGMTKILMIFYRVYQIFIMIPILVVLTMLTSLCVGLGSICFGGRFWGYYPAKLWAKAFCWLTFVRVTVKGHDNISGKTSYVFVANHQGAYDIFAIYGWLGHNFKWMMKKSLQKIPMVGYACLKAGHIYVDKSSPTAIKETMETAEKRLAGGMSVVVFPEGSRSKDGKVHAFKRGAFMLATEFNLPVVPVTIDGAFDVMPRNARLPRPGHITLTIHHAIEATSDGHDLKTLMEESRQAIESAL
jgi:1-acyl-sn-glycerol-3-phosphate acyltransferase